MFTAIIIHNNEKIKTTQGSINEWINKMYTNTWIETEMYRYSLQHGRTLKTTLSERS
jgi:hypothetical protein